jgi:hypothetical protein
LSPVEVLWISPVTVVDAVVDAVVDGILRWRIVLLPLWRRRRILRLPWLRRSILWWRIVCRWSGFVLRIERSAFRNHDPLRNILPREWDYPTLLHTDRTIL